MDHVGPDFQRHRHVRTAERGGEASRIGKQGFGRSDLDQRRRKAAQVGIERRNPWIFAVQAAFFVVANPALRAGTFARATVTLGQSCGIAIPLSAVLYGREGAVVQVVRGQRVETRAVTTGLTSDGKVQITKGLAEGDTVVMRAGAFLRDGDRVRPVDYAGASR